LLAGCQALDQQSYSSRDAASVILALDQLPPEHPLRNRPLFEIGASYQWCNTKVAIAAALERTWLIR
jgi:hypothetical protein